MFKEGTGRMYFHYQFTVRWIPYRKYFMRRHHMTVKWENISVVEDYLQELRTWEYTGGRKHILDSYSLVITMAKDNQGYLVKENYKPLDGEVYHVSQIFKNDVTKEVRLISKILYYKIMKIKFISKIKAKSKNVHEHLFSSPDRSLSINAFPFKLTLQSCLRIPILPSVFGTTTCAVVRWLLIKDNTWDYHHRFFRWKWTGSICSNIFLLGVNFLLNSDLFDFFGRELQEFWTIILCIGIKRQMPEKMITWRK